MDRDIINEYINVMTKDVKYRSVTNLYLTSSVIIFVMSLIFVSYAIYYKENSCPDTVCP